MLRSTAIVLLVLLVAASHGASAQGGGDSAAEKVDAAADGEVVAGKDSAEVDPAYLWTI
jgi:hypothetical protein